MPRMPPCLGLVTVRCPSIAMFSLLSFEDRRGSPESQCDRILQASNGDQDVKGVSQMTLCSGVLSLRLFFPTRRTGWRSGGALTEPR